jgi:uncharacterized protein YjbJ (UPF0337 family)
LAERPFTKWKETKLNRDRIEGNWKQFKGKLKERWGKLTDDPLNVIAGKREQRAGTIQEAYGVSKDKLDKQFSDWQKSAKEKSMSTNDLRTRAH